jgi:DNA primase
VQKDNIAEEIKSRCNIVDVVGRVVPLKKTGANHKGICPFHNEKTPSFVVSEDKQIYTCFGCGAAGDVIQFVEQYYSLDFRGAMEKLADEYGIPIRDHFQKDARQEQYLEINREAATFFYKNLWREDNAAYRYMIGRGISPETMKKFGIGYAEPQWDSLLKHFEKLGIEPQLLVDLGLVSQSKGKYFDKYRNRVIFPILNTRGKIIGFGGRAIGEDNPKYLNSSESSVFMKKNNLYGLSLTRSEITKEGSAILVEGYMDVIALYQGGVRNCCASLGTALTENQARLLKRYTNTVYLSYDGDQAGQNAALRGMDILYREGLQVKVLQMEGAKDPDEFIKKRGRDAFLRLMKDALPFMEYKLQVLKSAHDLISTEGRIRFLKEAAVLLRQLSPVEIDAYISKLGEDTGIAPSAIRLEVFQKDESREPARHRASPEEEIESPASRMDMGERCILKLILRNGSFLERIGEEETVKLLSRIRESYRGEEVISLEPLRESLEEQDFALIEDILEKTPVTGSDDDFFQDCINSLQQRQWSEMEKDLIDRLSLADEEENYDKIQEITQELMDLQKLKNRDRR